MIEIVGSQLLSLDHPGVSETYLTMADGKMVNWKDVPIGAMFHAIDNSDWPTRTPPAEELSDFYFTNNAHRKPLFVKLPNGSLFCIDGKYFTGGRYHGWLKNGVLSDDVEGRQL